MHDSRIPHRAMMPHARFLLPLLLLLATPLTAQEGAPAVTITIIDGQRSASESTVLPALPENLSLTYPLSALTDGIEGSVPLSLSIDATGAVVETRMLERPGTEIDPRLLLAAVDLVKSVTFSPSTVDGAATAMPLDVEVRFALPTRTVDTASTESYPDYVPSAVPPSYDPAELMGHVVYPPEAEEEGIEGTVYVAIKLDQTGAVIDATVIKSAGELLDAAALEAIGKTSFTPGIQDGKPIKMKMVLPIKFVLVDSGPTDPHSHP